MPNLSTAQMLGIVSIVSILSGLVIVENMKESYYCPTEDNVKECLRLSSSGITCYYLTAPDITKGDRCTGGFWEPLVSHVTISEPSEKGSSPTTFTDDCIIKGKWCYCNPRGNLDNKRLC